MIAVALVPREKVRVELQNAGGEFVEAIDERTDAYRTAWGYAFTVPAIGEDGMCPRSVLHEIMAGIERTRPTTQ